MPSIPAATPYTSTGANAIYLSSARVIPEKVPSLRIFLFKLNHLHKLD